MSLNQNHYTLYQLAKDKLRDVERELDAAKLAREARKAQPGLMKIALNQGSRLVTAFVLKLEKGIHQRGSRLYREADQSGSSDG
jgi:hypothetical protein